MELNILKIASSGANTKKLNNFTHSAFKKNHICGDYIDFKIYVKNNCIHKISFETKSCVYCQASANLLCKFLYKQKLDKIFRKLDLINEFYDNQDVEVGDRFGIIRFGSRVDVYLPAGVKPNVVVGQLAIGGETVLAQLHSDREALVGVAK